MYQTTIFDFLEPMLSGDPDFTTMTDGELADYIGSRTGLHFTKNKDFDEYRVVISKVEFTIHKSNYSCKERKGVPFIACGVGRTYGDYLGIGSPVDSIEEAIKFFKTQKERFLA